MKPLSRTHCQVDDTTYKLYPINSPLWYKKPDGTFDDIDLTFRDTTSTIGDISLMDKGIASVGKRKGNNPNKIVGIRPDGTQHLGTQQLEFSLINVELDGESQDFNVETDLEIRLEHTKVNQLVKLNKPFRNCKIEFDIYTKGIELQNNKYTSNTKIVDYGFKLTNIGENNGNTTLGLHNNYSRLNKDIPYFDFNVGKITDKYITTGEYSLEEEFGDSDLSNYIINENMYDGGSAVCYENTIIFTVQSYNIENYEDIIINNLCDTYGLEVFDDGGIGQYLTKDKKKVIGYYATDNVFFGFINTNDISDEIKALFKRKSFQDTSFLDISLTDFCNDMTSRFNKDLTIEVNSNYYEPIGNRFDFKISEKSYYIDTPIAFDSDYNILNYYTTHTLTDNEDGSYRYTKYLKPESSLNVNTAQYLDANLPLDQSNAGNFYWRHFFQSTIAFQAKTTGYFDTQRHHANCSHTQPSYVVTMCGDYNKSSSYTSGQTSGRRNEWRNYQQYFNFDTSGISDAVTSATLKVNGYGLFAGGTGTAPTDIEVILIKATWDGTNSYTSGQGGLYTGTGTAATLHYEQWNDFTGFTSDWDSDDVTDYSSNIALSNTSYQWVDLDLNSTARGDITSNSSLIMCAMDYEQWYQNSLDTSYIVNPSVNGEARRQFSIKSPTNLTTSDRPYIEYSTGTVSTPTDNATFFGTNF